MEHEEAANALEIPEGEEELMRLALLSHPDEWVESLPGIVRVHHLPAGHYTLFAVSNEGTSLHREELDMPATGEPSFDLRPAWRPFPAR
ncbi:hypothetical protein [Corallococcus sp. Z5C101001]|uniref:hypothetical protein n=1 Tax=Corallococcus sp. Z5C101001 TaxID=2596829 RepID=UPI00117FDE60|nr:hypothetical protein [Corallococcus sp. Z5C101001]TSC31245.1 hypothetical protein FOF48_11150 [Corallococcus sp. Z5C101001]